MIRKILTAFPAMRYNCLLPKNQLAFSGYEPRIEHSLIANINELRNFEQFFSFYKENQSEFSVYIYSVAGRRLARMLKDYELSKKIDMEREPIFKTFINGVTSQDFDSVTGQEIKSFLFMCRTFRLRKKLDLKMVSELQRKVIKRANELASKDEFALTQLINIYYDMSTFTGDCVQVVDKIYQALNSHDDSHTHDNNRVQPYHLFQFLKGCQNRKFLTTSQERTISAIISFSNQKIQEIEYDVLIKIMNSMNFIRLNKMCKTIDYAILTSFVNHITENIQELQIGSIFNILSFKSEIEDHLYKNLYETIQNNLFSAIDENGQTDIEVMVLFNSFVLLSDKKDIIQRPTSDNLTTLIKLVNEVLKSGQQKQIDIATRELAMLIQRGYLTHFAVEKLTQILYLYPNAKISFRMLYQLSIRKIDLQSFIGHIKEIVLTHSVLYMIQISVAVYAQAQINPQNKHLQLLKQQANKLAQGMTVDRLRLFCILKNTKSVVLYHKYFSHLYLEQLQPLLVKPVNCIFYLRYLFMNFPLKTIRSEFAKFQLADLGTLQKFYRYIYLHQYDNTQLFHLLIWTNQNWQTWVNKKYDNLVFQASYVLTENAYFKLISNRKCFYSYNKFLKMFAKNLPKFEENTIFVNTFINKVQNTRLKKLENSLYWYEFLRQIKEQLPKLTNKKLISKLVHHLIPFNIISPEQAESYSINQTRLEIQENPQMMRPTNIDKYVRFSNKFGKQDAEKIISQIQKIQSHRVLKEVAYSMNLPENQHSLKVINCLLKLLTERADKFTFFNFTVILSNLHCRYNLKSSQESQNFLKEVIKFAKTFMKFLSIKEHCFYAKVAIQNGVYDQEYLTNIEAQIVRVRFDCKEEEQFLIEFNQKKSARFEKMLSQREKKQAENDEALEEEEIQDESSKEDEEKN